jgi:ABC-type Fe3+-citrate transport system substrate-binding protein
MKVLYEGVAPKLMFRQSKSYLCKSAMLGATPLTSWQQNPSLANLRHNEIDAQIRSIERTAESKSLNEKAVGDDKVTAVLDEMWARVKSTVAGRQARKIEDVTVRLSYEQWTK